MKRYRGPDGEDMVVMKLDEGLQHISPERLAQIETIKDKDIDTSDIPDMSDNDEFWENATVGWPPPRKVHLSVRLDDEIVDYFKRGGRGYQSRINAVLRAYVERQLRAEAEKEQQRAEKIK